MFSEFAEGDTVSVSYTSKRSDNVVTRTGTVLQTPGDGKKGFFVQTDEDQWTGVMGDRVNSLTIGMDGDEREITRQTYVGELESVSKK